jgi:simple sugar transport system substrate-binding protein
MKQRVWVAFLAALVLALAACTSGGDGASTTAGDAGDGASTTAGDDGGDATTTTGDGVTTTGQVSQTGFAFDLIFHGDDPTGTFWNVMYKGLLDACDSYGADCNMIGDGDVTQMAALIDTSVANQVDGIITTLPNVDALRDAIQGSADAGIPVVTINSGSDVFDTTAALAHVGQDEYIAGLGGGERLAADGATNILCVIHEANNAALTERCRGVADGAEGATVREIPVDINNLDATFATIAAEMTDTSIDAVITLNPDVAIRARDAIAEAGSSAVLSTFDLGEEVLNSIEAGTITFAIDQQQYLQGYLPVVQLVLNLQNGHVIGGGSAILTGPGFVDASNLEQVREGVAAQTR